MKLRSDEVHENRYFFRENETTPERGPFMIEHLRDLFEFGHLKKSFLIREEIDGETRVLENDNDLLQQICPERERLHMGTAYQAEDKEAHLRPIDVAEIYSCEDDSTVEATAPRIVRTQPVALARPSEAAPQDENDWTVKEVLQHSCEQQKAARVRDQENGGPADAARVVNAVTIFRWLMMLGFTGFGVWVWSGADGGGAVSFVFDFLIGLALVSLGIVWILPEATRLASIPFNLFFENLIEGAARGPVQADFTQADALLAKGDRAQALLAYKQIMKEFPHDLAGYTKAYRLSRQLGQDELADSIREKAFQKLRSKQDINLFRGSVTLIDREAGLVPTE